MSCPWRGYLLHVDYRTLGTCAERGIAANLDEEGRPSERDKEARSRRHGGPCSIRLDS